MWWVGVWWVVVRERGGVTGWVWERGWGEGAGGG